MLLQNRLLHLPRHSSSSAPYRGWLSPRMPPRAGDLPPLCTVADGSAGCQPVPIPCSSEQSLIVLGSNRKETCCFLPPASPLGRGPASEGRYQRLRSRANKPRRQQQSTACACFLSPCKTSAPAKQSGGDHEQGGSGTGLHATPFLRRVRSKGFT